MIMDASTKKLLRSKSGLRIVVVNDRFKSPFVLSEPQWSPDGENERCVRCRSKFDFLNRKHHCRRCGQVYCKACCFIKEVLQRMCFVDPVRLCIDCENITRKENVFFNTHLKVLLSGARFKLTQNGFTSDDFPSYFTCKLSPDHRHILFDGNPSHSLEPLAFVEIKSVSMVHPSEEDDGNVSLAMLYRKSCHSSDREMLLSSLSQPVLEGNLRGTGRS
ncbi:hypothetical protein J437_LFUL008870 [Ladona fulva]|uniref:FYVE-type domain-containing protein n=1 Tax=Ladona fulva TaxID=123851 RepID=A0A8K0P170_LADFU|nr:hypothetical protein J437_LFUL008870 [Ladona fulva]